jgi:hypothetical protein
MQQKQQPCRLMSHANCNSNVTAGSMQQQDPCNSRSYERSMHTTKAAMQQQQLCNNRINAATGSNQQQDPFNSRIHATAGAMNAAGIQQKQPCKQQQLFSSRSYARKLLQQPVTSNKHAAAVSIHQGLCDIREKCVYPSLAN